MSKTLPPIHPGEILLEEFLKPLEINPHQLAIALRVPPNRIAQIIAGARAPSADTALRLGRYFGVNPQFWMNLQSTCDLRAAARDHQAQIDRDVLPPPRLTPPPQ
jgi:addiction module HigA family antidote